MLLQVLKIFTTFVPPEIIVIMAPKTALTLLLACAALSNAQSANPGIGTNPNAQGATDDVTPGSGPNGYSPQFFTTSLSPF